ncbi:MAG: hypothetical protein IPH78_11925 [Bacteroidetes bacterium]|nr:hypothetical protein [Bacteroidota bacterium]
MVCFLKTDSISFSKTRISAPPPTITTNYIRPKADFYYSSAKTKGWKIGALYDHEINMIKTWPVTRLRATVFCGRTTRYMPPPDSATNKFSIEYVMRYEHRPISVRLTNPFSVRRLSTSAGRSISPETKH